MSAMIMLLPEKSRLSELSIDHLRMLGATWLTPEKKPSPESASLMTKPIDVIERVWSNLERESLILNLHLLRAIYQQRNPYKEGRTKSIVKLLANELIRLKVKNGSLRPLPCQVCGSQKRLQAHHDNYSLPYEIRWLCQRHHLLWHRDNKALYAPIWEQIIQGIIAPEEAYPAKGTVLKAWDNA